MGLSQAFFSPLHPFSSWSPDRINSIDLPSARELSLIHPLSRILSLSSLRFFTLSDSGRADTSSRCSLNARSNTHPDAFRRRVSPAFHPHQSARFPRSLPERPPRRSPTRLGSVKRGRCRSRIVPEGPLPPSVIVNSSKRERARATLRVGHKAGGEATRREATRRKRGMTLVVVAVPPVSFYDVTHSARQLGQRPAR